MFPIQSINKPFLKKFREILKKNNYTHENLLQLGINPFTIALYDLPILAYRNPPMTSFGILFHLFFLGGVLERKIINRLFLAGDIEELLRIKILEKNEDKFFKSLVTIIPYQSLYLVGDFILRLDGLSKRMKKREDLVYPASLDSVTLLETAVCKPVISTLDLGCGCGILSLIASKYSRYVIGIDINPRAVNFSRFNALLNNISNCQFICGDLYQPVENEKFDLILANPPYEITLEKTFLYKDGGRYGFQILQKIVEGASKHLNKGGICQVISRVGEFAADMKETLIKKWISDKNIRFSFQELSKMDIYQYAYAISTDKLILDEKVTDYRKYSQSIKKLLDHFNKIHLQNVLFGIITLQKKSGVFDSIRKFLVK